MAQIDPLKDGFHVYSYWGPRRETPAQLAARWSGLFERLAAVSPLFAGWTSVSRKNPPPDRRYEGPDALEEYYHQYQELVLTDLSAPALTELVAAGVCRGEDDEPELIYGYQFSAFTGTGLRNQPYDLSVGVHAGCWSRGEFFANTAHIETRPLCEENRSFLTLPVLKAAMLAIVDSFTVTWAAIYPVELIALWPEPHTRPKPMFNSAWVTYLSPRFAPLVTPPRSAIVERTPEGGLVMIATKDRFDVANELHLASARRIEKALAPVNALPWPPDAATGR